eukprot:gene24946-29937_t
MHLMFWRNSISIGRFHGGDVSTILVIEDDVRTASEIEAALIDNGSVTGKYDAIVLDRMLPGELDGLGVLSTLRAAGIHTPVLILSALSAVDERVRGLKAGGDDYLTKPFEFLELTARIDVLARRRSVAMPETSLRAGDLEADLLTHTVKRAGKLIDLLPREYRLLEYMMRHAGQI